MDLDTRRAPPRKKPAGPGLSRLAYRWKRGWGARLRKVGLIYLPVMALGLGAWQAVEMGLWQAHVESRLRAAADAFLDSPDLAIQGVRLTGADRELRAQVSGLVTPLVGTSAMRLDVNELRREIEAMGWIRSAELRRGPQGVLHVSLTKRVPAALWRDDQGILWVVDREGAQIV
ncbi:MAG: FtsQ-type POTRA domain-containing protein, partial [Pseudomonadota bacterium]